MNLEQVEEFMKEADPKGDGAVDIEELAQRLCPVKKWEKMSYRSKKKQN